MDCAAPSGFNGRLQTPWYSGRGLFLEPPYLSVKSGRWRLAVPDWLREGEGGGAGEGPGWGSREEAFCPHRDR
jgi:dethiobiotin synthetase/adenosylmethionine--8-amino-7-oxononanoate aminotransferase